MFKQFAVAAALALAASSSFAAAPTEYYGGVDVGATKIDLIDSHKASVGAFLGYGFNPNIAMEVGYRQLGKGTWSGLDFTVKQTQISAVGSLPINPALNVYGRLGYNKVKASTDYGYYDEDHSGVLYGLGLNYSFHPDIDARVEVQKPKSDLLNLSVGIVFKF